jgi:hypothetical protein
MDPCVPGTDVNNLRAFIRSELGVPKGYAKNYSQKMICDAFTKCSKNASSLPPMKYSKTNGELFLIDRNSPLKAREYKLLFETGKVDDIKRIAKKLGVIDTNKNKRELKVDITEILDKLGITEPIKVPVELAEIKPRNRKNTNYKNFFNNLNRNLNRNNSNVNVNRNRNLNRNVNRNNVNRNNVNRNVNRNVNNANVNQNQNMKNVPPMMFNSRKPKISPPPVRVNLNSNGSLNNLKNSVPKPMKFKPKVSAPSTVSVTPNKINLSNRIRKLKENIGYNIKKPVTTPTQRASTSTSSAQTNNNGRTVSVTVGGSTNLSSASSVSSS